ncbi:MAG: ATP-binding cassette domain-containing protein [Planctomycetaceae bacterium]|jgi:phospholipid/cholesterol/gamma-HCH transport system ATP-binding protein|nr:ATP-binding cassette domain-containing protein [Planctomycetaceae bacterium]
MESVQDDKLDCPLLVIRGVSKYFSSVSNSLSVSTMVLRDVSLTVNDGETIAIIGESGCGKTVLLKTMIRLFKPDKGKVIFDGRDLSELTYFELAQTRIRYGFVFQQAALFDSMTIGENIAFPLIQYANRSKKEVNEIVINLLNEVGLSEQVLTRKPAELSGGMRKRVGLARALALEPEIILYDEPTTGLDPIMSNVINELIISTHKKHNVTSILVTHDMKSVFKVADRVIMLYPLSKLNETESQVIFDGTPNKLIKCNDKRVREFVSV